MPKKYSDEEHAKKAAYANAWRLKHLERIQAYERARYAANPEKKRARANTYRLANPEKNRARKAAERVANRDKYRARDAAYQAAHPEQMAAYAAAKRARKANAPINDFTAAQWREMQAAYDHRCAYCGKRAKGRLTQDHITPLSKGGNHTLSNIVPACRSCNSRKGARPPLIAVQPLLLIDSTLYTKESP